MPSLNPSISFLSLPPELRIKVYEYALISPSSMYEITDTFSTDQNRSRHRKPIVTALLKTCRTINYEAAPILYGRNSLKATNSTPFSQWLEAIGPINIRFLKSIQIVATTFGPILIGCIPRINRPWREVFATLRLRATSLRDLSVYWCHEDRGNKIRVCDQLASELKGWEDLNLVIDNSTLPFDNKAQERVKAYVNNSQRFLEKKLGIPVLLGPFATELKICLSPSTRLILKEKNLA